MKKILVFLSFIFIATANAEPFTVGNKVIEIPTPKGFVLVTPQMDAVYHLTHQISLPNEILAYYIPEADVPIAMSGKIPKIMKYGFYVTANKTLKNSTINSKDFDYISQHAAQKIKQYLKPREKEFQDHLDKMSTAISNEFNLDMKLKYLDNIPLEMHYKTKHAFAFSTYIKYKTTVEDYEEDFVNSVTTTIVNTSGKIISLYCYAPQEELEWTRSNSIAWSEMILKNNPAPSEKSLINRTKSLWQELGDGFEKSIYESVSITFGLLIISLLLLIVRRSVNFTKAIINKFRK